MKKYHKPSTPKGLIYPSAEDGIQGTKKFLKLLREREINNQMKIINYFLGSLANQNRFFKGLMATCENGNQGKILDKNSDWCKRSSQLAIEYREKIEK